MKSVSVIIPSRTQILQAEFLAHAFASINEQSQPSILAKPIADIELIVALDTDSRILETLDPGTHITYVQGSHSQASALNAGAKASHGDYIAFLEDDDTWHPQRLAITLPHLEHYDFCSSTQLEVEYATGNVIRINDFPTPSSWIMRRSTWETVGPFNENFRFHLDNEWLGRLAASNLTRTHLVESTAPVDIEHTFQVRPWLTSLLQMGGSHSTLTRHSLPVPLVIRTIHPGSGMDRIQTNPECRALSQKEHIQLQRRFHRIPW